VFEWRVESLVRAGFDPETALDLAFSKHVELHAALRLVDADCPAETAARILL